MRIVGHGATDTGLQRDHNEDCFLIDEEIGLYIVCDGMGGHAAGEVASQTAVERVRSYLRVFSDDLIAFKDSPSARTQLERLVRKAVEEASSAVYTLAMQEHGKAGMGTTLSMVVIRDQVAVMGHVGDSRVYLARDGAFHQLSQDHTYVAELVRGGLSVERALNSGMAHVITRSVGFEPTVTVDTLCLDIVGGDRLLLCSDGLVGHIETPKEIGPLLATGASAQDFIGFGNAMGGNDNITAVVIHAEAEATRQTQRPDRDKRVLHKLDTVGEIWLFKRLDLREIAQVTARMSEVEVEAGDSIIREGSEGTRLYIVLAGDIAVSRAGVELAVLRAGQHFGEMALVTGKSRSANVVAKSAARLLVMERDDFVRLVNQQPRLGVKLLWTLSETLIQRLGPQ